LKLGAVFRNKNLSLLAIEVRSIRIKKLKVVLHVFVVAIRVQMLNSFRNISSRWRKTQTTKTSVYIKSWIDLV